MEEETFLYKISGQQMSKANLMLLLNEALQKAGKRSDTCFSLIRYALLGVMSALLTEKANVGLLIL